jgi:hypothetical protein
VTLRNDQKGVKTEFQTKKEPVLSDVKGLALTRIIVREEGIRGTENSSKTE